MLLEMFEFKFLIFKSITGLLFIPALKIIF